MRIEEGEESFEMFEDYGETPFFSMLLKDGLVWIKDISGPFDVQKKLKLKVYSKEEFDETKLPKDIQKAEMDTKSFMLIVKDAILKSNNPETGKKEEKVMHKALFSAEDSQLEPLTEGKYAATWSGYLVKVVIDEKEYIYKTEIGVRGINIQCELIVDKENNAFVSI